MNEGTYWDDAGEYHQPCPGGCGMELVIEVPVKDGNMVTHTFRHGEHRKTSAPFDETDPAAERENGDNVAIWLNSIHDGRLGVWISDGQHRDQ